MPIRSLQVVLGECVRWYITRAKHPLKPLIVARCWSWLAVRRLWVRYDGTGVIGLRLDDYLQQRIFLDGAYERPLLDWLHATLTPDDVCWDIGANVGAVSVAAARRCRRVVAFEPDPRSLPVLRANLDANHLVNVTVIDRALGSAATRAVLYQAESGNTGMTSLLADRAARGGRAEVQVMRGDDLVAERPELFPTVMKIDVEGAEHAVLGGLTAVLGSGRVRAIVFEDGRTADGSPANGEVVRLLTAASYAIAPLGSSDDHASDRMFNFLATRTS